MRAVWVAVFCCAIGSALAPAQTLVTLASFSGANGANPSLGSLIQGTDGNFYGTTQLGGANGEGTVFKITPTGTLTTLYSFCAQTNCTDGANPVAGLVQAADGNFYGTTVGGGSSTHCNNDGGGCGTVFQITSQSPYILTTLHSFCTQAGCPDGSVPTAALVQGRDGNFYGTTELGGGSNDGTIFQITSTGTLATLHSFSGADGLIPAAGLVQGTDGNFYGTAQYGGASGSFGTVFQITSEPPYVLTTLYSFSGADGANPNAGLVQATDGNFYGTTQYGGAHNSNSCDKDSGCGTIFQITAPPNSTLTTLYNFCAQGGNNCTDGSQPLAGLVQATDGNFYGTTAGGGAHGYNGTVFEITFPPNSTLTTLYSFCAQSGCTDGANPEAGVLQASNGVFYGTTYYGGGLSNLGTVWGLFPSGTLIPTTTAVTSLPDPSDYLEQVTFTATVMAITGESPPGTATFTADGNTICSAVPLMQGDNGSTATCQSAMLTAGQHTILASYSGNFQFAPSQSPSYTQTVTQAVTTTVITANPPSPSMFGQMVTFTALVTGANGGSPTGTVNFTDGANNPICIGVVLVPQSNGSTATCQTSSLAVGSYTIAGTYSGDTNFTASSGSIPYQVNETSTTVTLAVMPTSATAGQVVTLTATVTANQSPGTVGTVTFFSGTQVLGTVQLNLESGTATLLDRFGPGSYTLTAHYNGTNSFGPATSAPQSLTVTGTEPTISTLTATPDGSNYDFGLSVFGFGFPPLAGSAMVNDLTQSGMLVGSIALPGPGMLSFQAPTGFSAGTAAVALATGDFNGDGIPDLAVATTGPNQVFVLFGDGHGGFSQHQVITLNGTPSGIATFDLDGDGNLDLAVSTSSLMNVALLYGSANGSFQSGTPFGPTNGTPNALAIADFDLSGRPGLAIAEEYSFQGGVEVVLNQGNRNFEFGSFTFAGQSAVAIASGDFNNDGIPDVAIADQVGNQALVFLGKGDGTLQQLPPLSAGHMPSAIAVGDLDGDGNLDVVVANRGDNTISVFLGDGTGHFGPQIVTDVGMSPDALAIADFNGDGILDVAVGDGSDDNIEVLLGMGNGSFQPPIVIPDLSGFSRGIIAMDLNGDSVPDLATASSSGGGNVLLGGAASSGTLSDVPVYGQGTQTVDADFAPQGTVFASSTSNSVQVTGVGLPTTTVLTSTPNPSTYLQIVTITATVTSPSGGHPTGTVAFADDGNPISGCTAVMLVSQTNGSAAVCMTSSLAVGSHAMITGTYGGDSNYAGSNGVLSPAQVVNQAATTTSITANPPSPSMLGQLVTFTATVTGANGGSPTGSVTFLDGDTPICNGVVLLPQSNGSTATCQTSSLALGSHTIAGTYSGDNNFTGGSGSIPYQVNETSTTVTLAVMPTSATAGQVVTLTATVTANQSPVTVGTVTLLSGTQVLGTVQLNQESGTATLLDRFGPGSYTLTAQYNGTQLYSPSTSSPQSLTVTGTEPTISTLTSTPDGSNYDFGLSVFGFGFPSPADPILAGSAMLNNLTQGGTLLGTINIPGPGVSSFGTPASYTAGNEPVGIAVGDFNGDGIPDLAIVNNNGNDMAGAVSILLGNGDGTFTLAHTYQAGLGANQVVAMDFNGDGNLDLAVTNSAPQSDTISVFLGNGDGTFQPQQTYPANGGPLGIVEGDFNNDGIPDLAVTNSFANTVSVLLGNGQGGFQLLTQTFPVGNSPVSIATADFNADGIADLAVTNIDDGTVSVLLGNGDGTFQAQQPYTVGAAPEGIVVGYFQEPGVADLAVANSNDDTVSILLGNGNGTFQSQVTYPAGNTPFTPVVADFNGDGIADLAVSNFEAHGGASVLLGNGNGTFQPAMTYPIGSEATGLAVADFNGDSVPDLAAVVTDLASTTVLLGGTVSTGALNNIQVTGTGNQSIQANFAPSGTFYAGSLSNIVAVAGSNQIPTTTMLVSSQNPSMMGQPVTFTSTVLTATGAPASGVVTFQSNGGAIPQCPNPIALVNGVAACTTSSLAVGSDTILASFTDPTGTYANSSASLVQTVIRTTQIPTTTTLTSSQNPSQSGQPVTFTATVRTATGGPASGVVSFQSNSAGIPECPNPMMLTNGVAACTTSSLAAGSDTILASFSDPTGTYASSSATLTQTVQTVTMGDYQISITAPSLLMVTQGYSNATDPFFAQPVQVTVSALHGYSGMVSLSCSVSPPLSGGSCVVNAPTSGLVDAPLVTTLTISAGGGTPIGPYMITVSGQDQNGLMHQANQNLMVINSAPGITECSGCAGRTQVYFPGPPGTMIGNFSCPMVTGTGLNGSQPLSTIGGNCAFTPTSGAIPGPIMVTISGCTVASLRWRMPIYASLFFGLPGLVLLGSLGTARRRNLLQVLGTILVITVMLLAVGCGGYGPSTPTGHYQVLVQATGADGTVYSAVVPVTVTPLQ